MDCYNIAIYFTHLLTDLKNDEAEEGDIFHGGSLSSVAVSKIGVCQYFRRFWKGQIDRNPYLYL